MRVRGCEQKEKKETCISLALQPCLKIQRSVVKMLINDVGKKHKKYRKFKHVVQMPKVIEILGSSV